MLGLDEKGQVRQSRAALAARTAIGCAVVSWLVLVVLPWSLSTSKFLQTASLVLGLQLSYLIPEAELGNTMKLSLNLALSTILHTIAGTATSYACYLVSDEVWLPWALGAGISLSSFILVIWGQAAASLQAPNPLFLGNVGFVWISALVPGSLLSGFEDIFSPLRAAASLSFAVVTAAAIALLMSSLPCIGAVPARVQVPALLSAQMSALADYFESVAVRRAVKANAQRQRRRFEALKCTAAVRAARTVAENEKWFAGEEPELFAKVAGHAEACRLATQLAHFARLKTHHTSVSKLVSDMMLRGDLGEAILDLAVSTSQCLQCAATLLAKAVGMPTNFREDPALKAKSMDIDVSDAIEAADDCEAAVQAFDAKWHAFMRTAWKQQLANLDGAALQAQGGGPLLQQAYLSSEDTFKESRRFITSCWGMCSAAQAAVGAARSALDLAAEINESNRFQCPAGLCCGVGVGLFAWVSAPFAGYKTWKDALSATWRHALRHSVVSFLIVAVGIELWPENQRNTFWALVSAALCLQPGQGATIKKGIQRVLGSLLGAALGIASAIIALQFAAGFVWTGMVLIALVLKFLDKELQYAGAVTWITYCLFIQGLTSHITLQDFSGIAMFRLGDVALGVLFAMIASLVVFPERATDQLKQIELDALGCVPSAVEFAAEALVRATQIQADEVRTHTALPVFAGNTRHLSEAASDAMAISEEQQNMQEVQREIRSFQNKLAFGGDGLGHEGAIQEAKWEIWASRSQEKQCLEAVPLVHRVLRQCNALLGVLHAGLDDQAWNVLNDERVARALGPGGSGLTKDMKDVVQVMGRAIRRKSYGSLRAPEGTESSFCAAKRRISLLLEGAAASRSRAGGILGEDGQGTGSLKAVATMHLLEELIDSLQRLGVVLSPHEFPMCEPDDEQVEDELNEVPVHFTRTRSTNGSTNQVQDSDESSSSSGSEEV
eukprot:TRINITY_DN33198_c0_g1_i1.p1 TRINITY_DN33198_c0_g1~~TRINITY_DN33198_c0_g1_i1.p1  ORF type:complete len:952 (-),score=212.10 TRINITY_DN33198_c0_g1_i1:49-2904(-)